MRLHVTLSLLNRIQVCICTDHVSQANSQYSVKFASRSIDDDRDVSMQYNAFPRPWKVSVLVFTADLLPTFLAKMTSNGLESCRVHQTSHFLSYAAQIIPGRPGLLDEVTGMAFG